MTNPVLQHLHYARRHLRKAGTRLQQTSEISADVHDKLKSCIEDCQISATTLHKVINEIRPLPTTPPKDSKQ